MSVVTVMLPDMTNIHFWQPLGLLLVALATLILTYRRPRLDQRYDGVRTGADALCLALGDLRAAVWAAKTTPDSAAISRALWEVDEVFRRHGGRLPAGLTHVRHSVTSAVTNYAGGTVSPYDPRLRVVARDMHDDFYWEIAVEYIQHASRAIGRWRDRPHDRGHRLPRYDEYRAEEDGYGRSR
jgi:hypothetical protein